MPNQVRTFFLEEWLRSSSSGSSTPSPSSSARAIIQAWAELRDSLQHQTFQPQHLQSLRTLLNSQTSLHVADPQAKLLLSILSSSHISLPPQSHPLFLRLLYTWLRKSSKPSLSLVELTISVLSRIFSTQPNADTCYSIIPQGVLLLGAVSSVPLLSESSKRVCLELLCKSLEEEYRAIGFCEELVPEVLAGIGYALSSSGVVYFSRILSPLFGIWSKEGGPPGLVTHGLMILHLIEWVISGFTNFRSFEKLECLCQGISVPRNSSYSPFAVVMAAAGALRALNKFVSVGGRPEIVPQLRNFVEECIEAVARDVIGKTEGFGNSRCDPNDRLLLHCISLGLSRSGPVSFRAPLLSCLASALLFEIFPLQSFYKMVAKYPLGNSSGLEGLELDKVKQHLDSVLFKEAGAITRAFCNQYVSADEKNKGVVENFIWGYCQDVYSGHRQVALLLQGGGKELLGYLEKIAEASFLMVVVFASMVTNNRLNSKFSREMQLDVSVKILISFSCIEYFRRVRLPEYTDTIRGVVVSVQENVSSCVSFIESMPSYTELTDVHGSLCPGKMEYIWSRDDVQTARILFYLRVIPTCIERVPGPVFRKVVAPTMFLYMGHTNGKVARASHSVFVAFISSGKDSNQEDRELLKEQLVFYYIQRALEGYPELTPFEGMALGVAALVRHLPAGSPAIFYCIHSLVDKANTLCGKDLAQDAGMWKNWQGDSEPSKKVLELLLRLISLVDIQVLPNLMKLLAQFILQLPKDGQSMVLDEIYSLVAESDDVTRKPALVSWLQSLSFLCSQNAISNTTTKGGKNEQNDSSVPSMDRVNARL